MDDENSPAMRYLLDIMNYNSHNSPPPTISIFEPPKELPFLMNPIVQATLQMDKSEYASQPFSSDHTLSHSSTDIKKKQYDKENKIPCLNLQANKVTKPKTKLFSTSDEKRFPYILWKIVNECKTNAIMWSLNGGSILINLAAFTEQYLGDKKHFKTKKCASFIRNLHLYGFSKVRTNLNKLEAHIHQLQHNRSSNSDNVQFEEYKHENFLCNRYDLLDAIIRERKLKETKQSGQEIATYTKSPNVIYVYPMPSFQRIVSDVVSENVNDSPKFTTISK